MTLPNMTHPLPSMKATRERPSQFLKLSHTSGCCSWKLHWTVSLDLREVRILHLLAPGLIAHLPLELGDTPSRTSASHKPNWGVTNLDLVADVEDLNLCIEFLGLSKGGVLLVHHNMRLLMFQPTLSAGCASFARWWCISTVNTLPVQGLDAKWVGNEITSSPIVTKPCSTQPASTSPTPWILLVP